MSKHTLEAVPAWGAEIHRRLQFLEHENSAAALALGKLEDRMAQAGRRIVDLEVSRTNIIKTYDREFDELLERVAALEPKYEQCPDCKQLQERVAALEAELELAVPILEAISKSVDTTFASHQKRLATLERFVKAVAEECCDSPLASEPLEAWHEAPPSH